MTAARQDAAVLSGTWYVTRTSLPLWRRWHTPSVTYAPLPDGRVIDTVRCTRGQQVRLIVGIDTPEADGWKWRGLKSSCGESKANPTEGRGNKRPNSEDRRASGAVPHDRESDEFGLSPLTRLVTSRWQVLDHDPAGQVWAVTLFARTPFTPAGLDLYTRTPHLAPELEQTVLERCHALPAARPFLPRLFAPRQTP